MYSKKAISALLAAVKSSEALPPNVVWEIVELIKSLQSDSKVIPNDILQVEWAYLPILDNYHGTYPKILEQKLADDPRFFCEIIRTIFKSKNNESTTSISEKEKQIAENAYRLLSEWRISPGTKQDGSFIGQDFISWLNVMKTESAKTGHLEIAMTMLGHVLIHAPPDPSGLWIDQFVAETLNSKDAEDIREGYLNGRYNARGVHMFSAGVEEKSAEEYRKQSEELESHGYHRFALTLKTLAQLYERDADYAASEDPFDE